MSEMMGMMNFVNQNSFVQAKVNGDQSRGTWKNEPSGNQSFLHTLQQALTQQMGQESLESLQGEQASEKMNDVLSQLLAISGYLDISMLEGEMNSELLSQIPFPLQEELWALFDQQIPLEALLTESSLTDPVQLLAIVMVFAHAEQQSTDNVQGDSHRLLTLLQGQIQQHFPIQLNEKEKNNWSKIVEKLTEQLKQFQRDSSLDSSSNLRSWLSSFNEKVNERELASSVYERVFQSNGGDKTTTNTLTTFDTTNSHMARLQQFFIHSGEQQTAKPSEQQFLRQFQNILARSQFQNLGNGLQQLTVKLHPESLGKLDITIQQINGVMVAKMMTTTAVAKELIESQLHQLRHAFSAQQLQVERIEVTQQQQTQNNPFKEQEQEHEAHQENREQANENEEDIPENESFSSYLEETINMEA